MRTGSHIEVPGSRSDAALRSREAGRAVASRAPLLALVAIVLFAFGVYAALGRSVDSPRAFMDELLYFDAAASIVEGDGLSIRGEPYRYAPLYPLVLAPLLWIASDREVAYELAKSLNALLFALTAVPVFLLARRLLPPWPSVVVAGLSVAIPSAMYVSVVMTESLAYFVASWAFLAVVLALERSTVVRQLAAVAAIGTAAAVRPQFAALYVAYIVGLALVITLENKRRPLGAGFMVSLWPTALSLVVAGVFAVVRPLLSGVSPSTLFGGYSTLWRSYDPIDVATFVLYELANLELYVGVVPFVVAPIVLTGFLTRGASRRHTAFAAAFLSVNAAFLLLVASFDSVDFRFVHDRYLFYLVPFWLIVLLAWLVAGVPRPRLAAGLGAAAALVLPFFLPFSRDTKLEGLQHINAMATTLWTGIDQGFADTRYLSGGAVLFMFTLALVMAALFLPVRSAWLLSAVILGVFAVTGEIGWYLAAREADNFAAPVPRSARQWLDEGVGSERPVTLLVASKRCAGWEWPQNSFYLTEFFNRSIKSVAHVSPPPDSLPYTAVRVARGGRVVLPSGAPLRADYVVAHSGVRLEGRRIGDGTRARLVLWDVRGPVRVLSSNSASGIEDDVCR